MQKGKIFNVDFAKKWKRWFLISNVMRPRWYWYKQNVHYLTASYIYTISISTLYCICIVMLHFIDINLPEAKRWLLISNVGRPRCFPDFPMGRNRWILSKERWWKLVTQFWGNHHASLNMFLSMLVAKVWGYHHTPLYSFSSIRDTISRCWGPHHTYSLVLVGFKWSKNRVSFLIILFGVF